MSERVALHEFEKAKKRLKVWEAIVSGVGLSVLLTVAGLVLWGIWAIVTLAFVYPGIWWGIGVVGFLGLTITAITMSEKYEKVVQQGKRYGTIDE